MARLSVPVLLSALALGASGAALALPAGADAASGSSAATAPVVVRHVPGDRHTKLAKGVAGGSSELGPSFGPESLESSTGPVANRSLSAKPRSGRTGPGLSGLPAASATVTGAPSGSSSFNGLNHRQQRLADGGNQFSLEPPDQALCVGNGYVVEAVNDAVAVYDSSGHLLALDSLNHFFGYPPAIDRSTGVFGPKELTDPTCLFDPGTGRFFLTQLSLGQTPSGDLTGENSLDTAVSSTGNPVGSWSITTIEAIDDGSGGTPSHPGCPCIGDYPHVGVDATGFYITTNEYPFFTDGYVGSQIYAMSKAQLASGAESVTVTQIDTSRAAPGGRPGFTVWPAQSPTTGDYSHAAGGTEYFLSNTAAEEAQGTGSSDQLLTWSLTNTSSLSSTPRLGLHVVSSTVGTYAVPLPADQKAGPVPLADCLNLTACAKTVWGTPDRYKETEGVIDPLDSRMQQVELVGGHLYGSHGTAVDPQGDTRQRAGIAWYDTTPTTASNGNLATTVVRQGRLGVRGNNLADPAIVRDRATGALLVGATLTGADHYPSAVVATIPTGSAAPAVRVLGEGVGPQDGFGEYRISGGRARWGDYGAVAVEPGTGAMWFANEWIAQRCTFAEYSADPLGSCGGTRTALANWATRISRVPAGQ